MASIGAIIIGGHVNGLGLVRSLAACRVSTAVIRTMPFDIAHRSRHVAAHEAAWGIDDNPGALLEALDRLGAPCHGWALIPANDGALDAVARHHETLASRYRLVAPTPDITRHFLDKDLMLDDARAVGIDTPRCYGDAGAAGAALANLRFPVVVKPVEGHKFFARFGCKMFAADHRDELTCAIARAAEAELPCRVFEFIPGGDDQIYVYCVYVDGSGDPCEGVTVRKIRQGPPVFGAARVAEIAKDNPELREATLALLRRTGYRGFAAAEFKRDARDGRFRFMEVNGRSVIYNGLLRKAGLDVSALAWADYVEGRSERARPTGWPGVWINLHADLMYSLLRGRREGLRFAEFLAPYKRPKAYAVWSARDPRPFLSQWSGTARRGAAALLRGKGRELLGDPSRPRTGTR